MDRCDVLIAGGGPAGSTCAWGLRHAGLEVVILDKAQFPRDKTCGGWITPAVADELRLDLRRYSETHTLQPITGFRTSALGGPEIRTRYGRTVSYGIRRCEFDQYLLARSGAHVVERCPVTRIERLTDGWEINGSFRARMLVGAGGHFCPVARFLGAHPADEPVVAAQEAEFRLDDPQKCPVCPEEPELYFCRDMKGYGWCFRKHNFLNIGMGRMDRQGIAGHVRRFVEFLRQTGRISSVQGAAALHGHAYLVFGHKRRVRVHDSALLIGDAAGLAWPQSGEGIRPAIESGLLAAQVIKEASGRYRRNVLERYDDLLIKQVHRARSASAEAAARWMPKRFVEAAGQGVLRSSWLTRHILLDRWFLGSGRPEVVS
jgi:menaquinone-9 beta-reductase